MRYVSGIAKPNFCINMVVDSAFPGSLGGVFRRVPWLKVIKPWVFAGDAIANRKEHFKLSLEKMRRLANAQVVYFKSPS